MLRVVLADDEVHIRNLLKYLIHWDEIGLDLVSDYDSGSVVVENIEHDKPDLIITDIKMPGITGLAMIQAVKTKMPECRCVIISGFRDFDFAQQAVKLGVSDYILKPIDEDELNETLTRISQEIAKQKEEKSVHSELRKNFRSVISGQGKAHSVTQVNQDYGFSFTEEGTFYVLLLKFCRKPPEYNLSEVSQRLLKRIEKSLASYAVDQEHFMYNELCYAILIEVQHGKDKDFLRQLDITYRDMLDSEKDQIAPVYAYLSCGTGVDQIHKIPDSLMSAEIFSAGRLGYGDTRVYIASAMPNSKEIITGTKPVDASLMHAFASALEGMQEKQALEIVNRELSGLKEGDWFFFFSTCRQFGDQMIRVLTQLGLPSAEISSLRQQIDLSIDNSDTVSGLETAMGRSISLVMHEYMQRKQDNSSHAYVQFAKDYIDRNYSGDISLAAIAEKAHVNASYLSAVFKESTGMNYSSYLTSVRIEKAKDLLKNVDMNISEVARAVGYDNQRYFSRIFEEETGIKPSQYRKLYLHKMSW